MRKWGWATALLALAGSSAIAAIDPAQWDAWKGEYAQLEQSTIAAFPTEPNRSKIVDILTKLRDHIQGAEATVLREAQAERVAITLAQVQGQIDSVEAAADHARLNKAVDIHLCYIYGSIVPRIFEEAFGRYVPASLRARFNERITRAEYVSLLRRDPVQGRWGDSSPGSPFNLSKPVPAAEDGR